MSVCGAPEPASDASHDWVLATARPMAAAAAVGMDPSIGLVVRPAAPVMELVSGRREWRRTVAMAAGIAVGITVLILGVAFALAVAVTS